MMRSRRRLTLVNRGLWLLRLMHRLGLRRIMESRVPVLTRRVQDLNLNLKLPVTVGLCRGAEAD